MLVILTVYTLFERSYSVYTLLTPNMIAASAGSFAMPLLTSWSWTT